MPPIQLLIAPMITVHTHSMECDYGSHDTEIACSSRVGSSVDKRTNQRTNRELAKCTLILELLEGDARIQEEGDNKDDAPRIKHVSTADCGQALWAITFREGSHF